MDPQTHVFTNRRVLAYIDAGIPDGIQLDTHGNVFASCADGVQVRLQIFSGKLQQRQRRCNYTLRHSFLCTLLGLRSRWDAPWEILHRNVVREYGFCAT